MRQTAFNIATQQVADKIGHGFTPKEVIGQMVLQGAIAEVQGGDFETGAITALAAKIGGGVSEKFDFDKGQTMAMMAATTALAAKATGADDEDLYRDVVLTVARVFLYNDQGDNAQKRRNLVRGSVFEERRRVEDIRTETKWRTDFAVGDAAATLIGSFPAPVAKGAAMVIDAADIVSVQSRLVTTGQDWVTETFAYDTLYDNTDSSNWVEYPGARRNEELINSISDVIWRNTKTERRVCIAGNSGCY